MKRNSYDIWSQSKGHWVSVVDTKHPHLIRLNLHSIILVYFSLTVLIGEPINWEPLHFLLSLLPEKQEYEQSYTADSSVMFSSSLPVACVPLWLPSMNHSQIMLAYTVLLGPPFIIIVMLYLPVGSLFFCADILAIIKSHDIKQACRCVSLTKLCFLTFVGQEHKVSMHHKRLFWPRSCYLLFARGHVSSVALEMRSVGQSTTMKCFSKYWIICGLENR